MTSGNALVRVTEMFSHIFKKLQHLNMLYKEDQKRLCGCVPAGNRTDLHHVPHKLQQMLS